MSIYNISNSAYYAPLVDNYIYISHLDEDYRYWIIPVSPERIDDQMQSNFAASNALGRSAPVFTYSNSGPRTMSFSFKLHRDLMDTANVTKSGSRLLVGEDYTENLIRALQSIAVPKYNLTNKAVEPPLVAIRIGNEVFIKGVVTSNVSVTYSGPIMSNGKYAEVEVSFTVSEVDPYDASAVFKNGSFRGLVRTMKEHMGMNVGED